MHTPPSSPFVSPAEYAERQRKQLKKPRPQKKITDAKWRKTTKGKAQQKRAILKYLYGLTPEQWSAMLVEQAGCCKACGKPMTGKQEPIVDHCHKTGRVRGLLCRGCNTAAGQLGDSAELALRLAHYLQCS